MTQAVATTQTHAVVAFRDRIRAQLEQSKQTVDAGGTQIIRTKDKMFTLPDGKLSAGPIQTIVLDFVTSHSYFPGVYNPKKPSGPVCWAKGKIIAELSASDNAPERQSDNCAECRFNQFGSGQGNAKACKQSYQLAIVAPNPNRNSPVLMINVSPASRRNWGAYVSELAQQGLSPIEVVTEISFDADSTYGALLFKNAGDNSAIDQCAPLYDQANEMLMREPKKRDD